MAALHSTMENSRGNEVSTINHKVAHVMCETWEVRVSVVLTAEGEYTILVTDRNTGVKIEELCGQYPAK